MNTSTTIDNIIQNYQDHVLGNVKPKPYRKTPFIFTFCETEVSSLDIKAFIEQGMKIVRFKISHVTTKDMISVLGMIKDAVRWCCDKYGVTTWPITISVDIPNACIRTGLLKEEINEESVKIKDGWIIEITSNAKYWNKCDSRRIFIDDPYIIKAIKVGTEVTIAFGMIVMVCTKIVDDKTIICKVLRGFKLASLEFVCVRGVKHDKPPLSKIDLNLIAFAKEYKLDIITINSVRWADTVTKIRNLFDAGATPLLISSICEQEGLDNFDEIIEQSDGIILAREFLAYEIINMNKMIAIQLQISAKCKKAGKPFFVSGNILERTLFTGSTTACDLNDITNAVLQGAGFVMKSYKDSSNVITAMELLNDICTTVESITATTQLWRMINEYKMPINAAEACIVASAVIAQQSNSKAFIVPSVTGQTAIKLSLIAPEAIIFTVSTNPVVVKQLQMYKGIVPIIYDMPPLNNWKAEMGARIKFAISYGLKLDILHYGENYVVLSKFFPTSSYCDSVSFWKVTTEEILKTRHRAIRC